MRKGLPYLVLLVALIFYFVTERMDWLIESRADHRTPVRFWAFSMPARTMNELRERFYIRNPDIRVEVQTVPWESLQQKTLWAIAANANVPDLVVGSSEWLGGLANSGGLEPLENHLPASFFQRYYPNVLGIYRFPRVDRDKPGVRGVPTQYGLPLDLDLMMIFYRADLLDPVMKDAGIPRFPETWEEFERLAAEVRRRTQTGPQGRHLLYLDPVDPVPMSMAFLPSSGGTFLDKAMNRSTLTSPEATAAFEFFGRLLNSGEALRWERTTMEDPLVLYKTDRVIANIAGPWYTEYLKGRSPEQAGKWRVAHFPRRTPGLPSSGLGGACVAMPHNAPNKKAAIKLLEFIAEDQFAMEYFRRVGSPPPQMGPWKSQPEFAAPLPYFGGQRVYEVVRGAIETAVPMQLMPSSEITKGPVREAMRTVSERPGETTEILRRAAVRTDEILESR